MNKAVADVLNNKEKRIIELESALHHIIKMNLQHAHDQYGDYRFALNWSCVQVAINVLGTKFDENKCLIDT